MQYNRHYLGHKPTVKEKTSKKTWLFIIIGVLMLLLTVKFSLGALTDSLTDYYKFDETTGTNAYNTINPLLNGTASGSNAPYSLGIINYGRQQTDTTSRVDITDRPIIYDYSVSMWVNTSDYTKTGERCLFGTGTVGAYFRISLLAGAGYDGRILVLIANGGKYYQVKTNSALVDNQMYHVVVTWKPPYEANVYINGTNKTVWDASDGVVSEINTGTDKTYIFSNQDATGGFDGRLDEVAIWNRTLTQADITALYNNGTSNISYPFEAGPYIANNILFSSQTPSDIDTGNLFNYGHLNISYNFNANSSPYNASTIRLNYTVINATSWVNGSIYTKNPMINYTGNTSTINYYFEIDADNLYPGTYPAYYIENMEEDNRSFYALSNNHYINLSLKNVRNDTNYGLFELMVNTSLGTSELRYCNSSYSGGNPISSANCYLFATFSGSGFNHTHGKSKHNTFTFPINTTNGRIGTVKITNQSYFLIRGTSINSTFIGYMNNATNIATVSTDAGLTYTPLNYTFDYHLHQFTGTETLSYFAYAQNTSGAYTYSSNTTDSFQQSIVPPTPPIIITPTATTYNQYINITYTPSINITGRIHYYNISLLDENDTQLYFIYNNSLNTSYYWNTYPYNLSTGTYYKIKVLASDTNTETAYSISEMFDFSTNGFLNISAYNNITGINITSFTVTATDINTGQVLTENTTNNFLILDVIRNHNYTLLFDASGYAFTYRNVTLTNQSIRVNQSLFLTNSFIINFYNETTQLKLDGTTINLLIYKDDFVYSNSSVGGGYYYNNNFTDGDYTFRYSADGYLERSYYLTVNSRSFYPLNFYLISIEDSEPVQISLRSNFGEIIENATIKLLRYYSSINSYTTVEMVKTNFDGKADMQIELQSNTANGEFYKFLIIQDGETVLETTPTKITTTNLNFIVVTGTTGLEQYIDNLDISYNLSFNTNTNNFKFTFNNANNDFVGGCLYVYTQNVIGKTFYNSSCINSSSATILLPVNNDTNTTYVSYAYVYYGDYEYYLDSLSKRFNNYTKDTFGKQGIFYAFIIILTLAFIGAYNPTISIVLSVFGLIVVTIIGLIPATTTIIIGIIAGAIIVIWTNKS